jgi:uncharacterized protein (TIGR03083 family)
MPDDPRSPITATVYLDHLDRESGRFADVLAGVDPAVPVPTCPGWTAADLVWHLTEVQWFWGSIAGGSITDDDAIEAVDSDKPERPEGYKEVLALYGTARERLSTAVADARTTRPCGPGRRSRHWVSLAGARRTRRSSIGSMRSSPPACRSDPSTQSWQPMGSTRC